MQGRMRSVMRYTVGFQPIVTAREGLVYGIRNPNLGPIFSTRPAAEEWCLSVIQDHYSRMGTRADAEIHPFSGMAGHWVIEPDRPRRVYYPRATQPRRTMLHPLIMFGTSTWAYEGWQGTVYQKSYAKGRFKKDCLAEYATYRYHEEPLFRTVGLDATFYRPPTDEQLRGYADQLPAGFEMCSKVWERITIPQFPSLPEYGAKAGQVNPDFLNVDLFVNEVLPSYRRVFSGHTGPFIFEFQRTRIAAPEFIQRLDVFLGQLPKDFRYAVEVRNPLMLSYDYRKVLQAHGVSHVYNHWTYMPKLAEQHRRLEVFTAPFVVFRLLTPLRVKYAQAVRMAEPYNRIVAELPEMRKDTVALIKQAVVEQRRAYVLVNNRSEGSAPLTVQALVGQLRDQEEQDKPYRD